MSLGNVGITPRLVIAFLSVAVLAATANLIVKNGAAIVQQVVETQKLESEENLTLPRRRAAEEAARQTTVAGLTLASGGLDTTTRMHAREASPLSSQQYQLAMSAVEQAFERFATAHAQWPEHVDAVRTSVRSQRQHSQAFVRAALDGRRALDQYATFLSAMNTRLQKSIEGAWKILGRVVARQSLLKMSAQLDAIQSDFADRQSAGLAPLEKAEQDLAFTLQKSAGSLRRSQGEQWLEAMRSDLAKMSALRMHAIQSEKAAAGYSASLGRQAIALRDTLSRETVAVLADAGAIATPAPAAPAANLPSQTARAERVETPRNSLVAWVSLIVLAVLAYICIVTIVSVVRPVRRLLRAMVQLANGHRVQPLIPGGIRELDKLSVAFNSMAEQLTTARQSDLESQRRLEGKVEERTRELKNLAERDPLTGLANRRQLFAALTTSINEARVSRRRVGAFFLDIDNFKTLNDSMGHAFGDQVLTAIARRLEQTAEAFGFAARLGGDEFMLVHEDAATAAQILAAGDAIVRAFERPIELDGRELMVSVSVGASIFPDHEQDAEALMRAADAALFSAKAQGRNRLALFTPELLATASAKFAIEQRLRRAIEKDEFELFYQPEIDLHTLNISMVEALIRLRMPDGSYECPGSFLAVAEESGLIIEINDWVLRTAVAAASRWHHGPWPEARVAINVSSRQFIDLKFSGKLRRLLDEFRLPARCIELELTESVLQTGPTTIHALTELRSMGVAIALDDFGTGYSSIASLEQLPLTRVKLDRSLIAHMDSSSRSACIARATIGLCSELGLEVTAEGVERLEQFSALLKYPGLSLQGYLLARPAHHDEVVGMLEQVPAHCQELVLSSRRMAGALVFSPREIEDASQPAAASLS